MTNECSENNFPIIDIVRFEVIVLKRRSMLRLFTTLFFYTIMKNEHVIFRVFLRNARKKNSSFSNVRRTCRGEPYVRPSYIGTKALLVRGRT